MYFFFTFNQLNKIHLNFFNNCRIAPIGNLYALTFEINMHSIIKWHIYQNKIVYME